jgi:hypothetical protein
VSKNPKSCLGFFEPTPGVVGERSEDTNPAGPAKKDEQELARDF